MKRFLFVFVVVALAGFLTTAAPAQPPGPPGLAPPLPGPGYGAPPPRPVVYDPYYLPYYRFRLYLYPQYRAPLQPTPVYSAYPPAAHTPLR